MIVIKIFLAVSLLTWIWLGFFLITRFKKLFGAHPDDPSETPGARSFGLAHIVTIWIGIFGLLIFFLIK